MTPNNRTPIRSRFCSLTARLTHASRWIERGHYYWCLPDCSAMSFQDAESLSRERLYGMEGWRLPDNYELSELFRSGLTRERHWPEDLYWSMERSANGFPYLILNPDGTVYLHDKVNDRYRAAFIRPAKPAVWNVVIDGGSGRPFADTSFLCRHPGVAAWPFA